jgi:hypothetical protein
MNDSCSRKTRIVLHVDMDHFMHAREVVFTEIRGSDWWAYGYRTSSLLRGKEPSRENDLSEQKAVYSIHLRRSTSP